MSKTILNPADIGLGNVENKSSATILAGLTSGNVTGALTYTPMRPGNIDYVYADYSVPTATYVPITLPTGGQTLTNLYGYRVELVTQSTGTVNGAVYVVYQTGASTWTIANVSNNGLTSNNPQLRISTDGTKLEVFHTHASTYGIRVSVKSVFAGNAATAASLFGLEGIIKADGTGAWINGNAIWTAASLNKVSQLTNDSGFITNSVTGTFSTTGNATIGGSLGVATTLNVTGATTLSNGLGVTGTISATGGVSASSSINAANGTDGLVNIGGDGNGAIELGKAGRSVAGTPFIDFHSSANNNDFDVRIIASGGTATLGQGNLNILANTFTFNSNNVLTSNNYQAYTAPLGGGGAFSGAGSFKAFSMRSTANATDWTWFTMGGSSDSAGNVWHFATNGAAIDIGAAGALHFRGNNGSQTTIALNQDHSVRIRSTDVQVGGYQVVHYNNIGSLNAGTATKLATPRNINGVAFDGSADITISTGANSNGETYNRQFVTSGAGAPATYMLLASLPISGVGTYDSCVVEATYGGWEAANKQVVTLYVGNRNAFTYSWETFGIAYTDRGIRAYLQGDGSVLVYAYVPPASYTTFAASVKLPIGFTPSTAGTTTVAPTGSVVFDSGVPATYKPRTSADMSTVTLYNQLNVRASDSGRVLQSINTTAGGAVQFYIDHNLGSTTIGNARGTLQVNGNASTATQLATPRAINGINFDGTAAISIQSSPGTFTLNNSGDLVLRANASQDVGDIIFAYNDGSEKYRIYDNGSGGLYFRYAQGTSYTMWHGGNMKATVGTDGYAQLISGTDLNTLYQSGFYRGIGLGNAPDVGWYYVLVEGHDTSWSKQTATSYTSGDSQASGATWIRVRTSAGWGGWTKISTGGYGMDHAVLRRKLAYGAGNGGSLDNVTQPEIGFTYSDAGPGISGPFIHFGGLSSFGDYGCQLVGEYNNGGNAFKIRTRNDDAAKIWNPWRTIVTDGNLSTLVWGSTITTQPTFNGNVTFARNTIQSMVEKKSVITASTANATITLDTANYGNFQLTISATPVTLAFGTPGTGTDTFGFTLKVINGAAGMSLVFPTANTVVKWPNGSMPTRSTGNGAVDYWYFWTDSNGSTWYGSLNSQDAK